MFQSVVLEQRVPAQARATPVTWQTLHNRCSRRCFCRRPAEHRRRRRSGPPPSLADCSLLPPVNRQDQTASSTTVTVATATAANTPPLSQYLSVDVRDGRGELQPIQQVVAVVIVHLEIMQLQFLRSHVLLGFVYHSVQMLHDVAERQSTHSCRRPVQSSAVDHAPPRQDIGAAFTHSLS